MEILKRGAVPADKIRMWGRLLFGIALAALLCCAWASPFWKMPPVSYTHLDVYKRQARSKLPVRRQSSRSSSDRLLSSGPSGAASESKNT